MKRICQKCGEESEYRDSKPSHSAVGTSFSAVISAHRTSQGSDGLPDGRESP